MAIIAGTNSVLWTLCLTMVVLAGGPKTAAAANLESISFIDDDITVVAPHAPVAATFVKSEEGRFISIRKVPGGTEAFRLAYPLDTVTKMAFSDDGRLLAATSGERVIWLWSVAPNSKPLRLECVDYQRIRVSDFTFCDKGRSIAATFNYGMAAVFSTTNGELLDQTSFRSRSLNRNNFRYMVAGLNDALVICDEIGTVTTMARRPSGNRLGLPVELDPVTALAASTESGYVVFGEPNGTLSVWKPGSDKPISRKVTDLDSITCLVLSRSGEMLLAGGSGGRVELFSLPDCKIVKKFKIRSHPIQSVGFGLDECSVVSASNGILYIDNLTPKSQK